MSSFEAQYKPLSEGHPKWGSIALLPWDEAIFGFPVADFQIGTASPDVRDLAAFREALLEFCRQTRCELISARVTATATPLVSLLLQAGFTYVDFCLLTTLSKLLPESLPKSRFAVRPAKSRDHKAIYQISGSAFQFGRYHSDPYFPRELANRRYVQWMRNALESSDPENLVFVLASPEKVFGFMHVVIRCCDADLRLGAVVPGSSLGHFLYSETLRAVSGLGATSASTTVSAANVAVLNIYSALGFRFSRPEVVLHWRLSHATGPE
jgi:hypothetical protein